MIGVLMGLVALLVIPGGLLLAWLLVRRLERRAAAEGHHHAAPPTRQAPARRPHPSTQGPAVGSARALDDAPAEVIAALAQQLATRADGRPGDTT